VTLSPLDSLFGGTHFYLPASGMLPRAAIVHFPSVVPLRHTIPLGKDDSIMDFGPSGSGKVFFGDSL
jgi:hypothetical protein